MKRKYFIGILTLALILGIGTSAYAAFAQGNGVLPQFMEEQGIDVNQMYEVMNSGSYDDMVQFMEDQNINFGQMLPYMQQMHPDLSTNELQGLYNSCHGTTGSSNSNNFNPQGMMGN